MADDREILREVWDGKVPVSFTLSPDEVEADRPETAYLMVPRQCYFPLVTDKIAKHLAQFVEKDKVGEMWLDFEGQPLKWHYPVGVLYDLYANVGMLPWSLTVHFQNFPEEDLLHCQSKETVESHFMSVVKEADALKHRSHVINGMQKKDHKQMWMGLTNDKFDQFWPVNKRMMENSGDEMFKYIPFRLYKAEGPYVQKLIKPLSEEGHEHTLADLLQLSVPSQDNQSKFRILIQGIELPLQTPLLWLSEHLSHPDNFLHICMSVRQSEDLSDHW